MNDTLLPTKSMNNRFLSINYSKMVSYNHVGDYKQR